MNDKNSELTEVYIKAVVHHQKGNLEEKKAKCESILYKYNRAVLFNSAYFHETDKIDFKVGYGSRKINITYLFGNRKIKKTN